jgi:hypothetical protein
MQYWQIILVWLCMTIFPHDEFTEDFKQNMQIVFDEYLPRWNYTAIPQSA